jgi:hypothetical protein
MRITAHLTAAVVLVLATATTPAAAVLDEPPTPLLIRLYAPSPAAEDADARAVEEARAILADAGFAAEWVRCPAGTAAVAARCAVPLAAAELAVRLVPSSPPAAPWRLPLGYSLLDARTGGGTLATIYVDRVRRLAGAAGADAMVLLGRAIAHEVGHLLLGTSRHARTGLMRDVWSRGDVRHGRPAEWRFLVTEARRMRDAVLARGAGRQMARVEPPEPARTGD